MSPPESAPGQRWGRYLGVLAVLAFVLNAILEGRARCWPDDQRLGRPCTLDDLRMEGRGPHQLRQGPGHQLA